MWERPERVLERRERALERMERVLERSERVLETYTAISERDCVNFIYIGTKVVTRLKFFWILFRIRVIILLNSTKIKILE